MRYDYYIKTMIGRVFKLLPMRESSMDCDGQNVYLDVYIDDLSRESQGAYNTFPELYSIKEYISFTNTLSYLTCHWEKIEFKTYRSSVLKMTNNLAHILESSNIGGDLS